MTARESLLITLTGNPRRVHEPHPLTRTGWRPGCGSADPRPVHCSALDASASTARTRAACCWRAHPDLVRLTSVELGHRGTTPLPRFWEGALRARLHLFAWRADSSCRVVVRPERGVFRLLRVATLEVGVCTPFLCRVQRTRTRSEGAFLGRSGPLPGKWQGHRRRGLDVLPERVHPPIGTSGLLVEARWDRGVTPSIYAPLGLDAVAEASGLRLPPLSPSAGDTPGAPVLAATGTCAHSAAPNGGLPPRVVRATTWSCRVPVGPTKTPATASDMAGGAHRASDDPTIGAALGTRMRQSRDSTGANSPMRARQLRSGSQARAATNHFPSIKVSPSISSASCSAAKYRL